MTLQVTYRVPEADCRALTDRPSYSGHSWDTLLRSAEITADAYGRAFIVCTKSNRERAGGKVYVASTSDGPSWTGLPIVLLATVEFPTVDLIFTETNHE